MVASWNPKQTRIFDKSFDKLAFQNYNVLLANVQSFRTKLDELTAVILNLSLVCLTEIWLSSAEIEDSLFHIPGFILVRSDCISRKGGGTAFYIQNSLHVEVHDTRA